MKILIDGRMYGLEHAGIGRYVANLVHEIKNLKLKMKNLEIILLVRKKNLKEIRQEFGDVFEIVVCNASHYSFEEQIILPLQLFKIKPDLVHFPHFNIPIFWRGKFVVTIHDLIKHTSRGIETTTRQHLLYWFKYLGYRFVFSQAIRRSKMILVPSQTVKKELVESYKLDAGKVMVTYEGIEKNYQSVNYKHLPSKEILEKYKIHKPFLIYTGSLYPHKNVERLVKTVVHLNNIYYLNISLVIVCARSIFFERFRQKVRELKAEKVVNFVGFVPDEDLVILYKEAEAFVFPTLSEGFGLPGLEAMAAGCQVICSDIPVLREIYGEAAEYFDPLNFKDIAQKIKEVCLNDLNHDNKRMLIEKGFKQIQKYSWQKMAQQTLEVYQKALS